MKKLLQIIAFVAISATVSAQETVNLAMGANYSDEVYFKLSNLTSTTFSASSWDVAFLRIDAFNHGVRVNDGVGIQVFEASNDPNDWPNIDPANEANWTPLYNDDTNWDNGAFMQGSATYGWGEYNPVNHHIQGTIIFVLKYVDGTYKKFIIDDYFAAYTFRYATWDGSAWVNEVTETVDNASNPDNRYNYYSFLNNQQVVAEPAQDAWDMVFRKYVTDVGGGMMYSVSGALHSANVTVAQNEEPAGTDPNPNGLDYSEEINTIGYDWKSFNGSGYDVNSDMAYYVKYEDNSVYRLVFTSFEGSSTGNLSFEFEDVSDLLGLEDVSGGVSFGMYPNPSSNGVVNVVYDVANTSANNKIDVYSMTGALVYSETANTATGFYNKTLNLSNLQSGVYVVTFTAGNKSVSKKLILQ